MIIQYVDDFGIAAPEQSIIDGVIQQLRNLEFELTVEGSFEEYLGIKVVRDKSSNSITMTQSGLINKILETTKMEDSNPNYNPTAQCSLGSDPDGPPMKEEWSYSSVVGMLLYLSTCTCPDIAFAVSQAARFSTNPKQSHATAVKTIICYLKRTRDLGIIMKPNGQLHLETFVDADFAGLYKQEDMLNPASAKSRTGYIIFLGNCPLIWKSQLQTEVSLSTLEAEYSALSASARQVIFTHNLLKETISRLKINSNLDTKVKSTIWEDNNGALLLATNQRITNRTKYFHIKWHHFWSLVQTRENPSGFIQVEKINTEAQRADYLTKGLSREVFERNRKLAQGW